MEFKILCRPSYSLLELSLSKGEYVLAERRTLVYMRGVRMHTTLRKGVLKRLLGGEEALLNVFEAYEDNAVLGLTSPFLGDIAPIDVGDVVCRRGAFIAGYGDINVSFKLKGLKTALAKIGFTLQRIYGDGVAFLASFGGVVEIPVKGELAVDNGHILAFDTSLDVDIGVAGGIKELFLGKEGIVVVFRGHGRVWVQTKSTENFLEWLDLITQRSK